MFLLKGADINTQTDAWPTSHSLGVAVWLGRGRGARLSGQGARVGCEGRGSGVRVGGLSTVSASMSFRKWLEGRNGN